MVLSPFHRPMMQSLVTIPCGVPPIPLTSGASAAIQLSCSAQERDAGSKAWHAALSSGRLQPRSLPDGEVGWRQCQPCRGPGPDMWLPAVAGLQPCCWGLTSSLPWPPPFSQASCLAVPALAPARSMHSDRGPACLEAQPYPCQLCHLQQVTIQPASQGCREIGQSVPPGGRVAEILCKRPAPARGSSCSSSPTQATGGALRSPDCQVQWLFSSRRRVLPWCSVVLPTYAWRLVAMVSTMLPPGSLLSCYPFGSQSPLLASPPCPGPLGPCPWPPSFPGSPCSEHTQTRAAYLPSSKPPATHTTRTDFFLSRSCSSITVFSVPSPETS